MLKAYLNRMECREKATLRNLNYIVRVGGWHARRAKIDIQDFAEREKTGKELDSIAERTDSKCADTV